MAGFTLGGGYSPLTGAYGLVLIIYCLHKWSLPMGNFSPQTPKNIPICFGDYAVGATLALSSRWSIACIHSRPCYLGCCSIRWEAKTVLRRLNDFTIPDELTILSGFIQMPEGATVLFLLPLYCVETQVSRYRTLRTFGTVLVDQVQSMTYREFIHQWDANAPKGVTTMLNTVDQRVSA